MKTKALLLSIFFTIALLSCSQQKTIEIALVQKQGYGHFRAALSGISTYAENESDAWKKTELKLSGAPANWTEIEYGDIETDIFQMVYQNYITGNISQERYEELQKKWDWQPDTLQLSKKALKTQIGFALGKDPDGVVRIIVDTNNNLDLSDEESFIATDISAAKRTNRDSLVLNNAIRVAYERFINNKIVLLKTPLFIAAHQDDLIYNFPQYSLAEFEGEKIAVSSDDFTSPTYKSSKIALLADSLKENDRISPDDLIEKGEFIELNGEIYKHMGVKNNTLILEKMAVAKSKLSSTQKGYKSFSFEGDDFVTESKIRSEELKGKYVLIDFWAVWCSPCLQELPHLKELYTKTNRENFEIIGIVADSAEETLRKMIHKDSIIWPQILSTETNKIKEKFKIKGYPTSFLLNPEGVIIAKNLRGKELEEKILELINE